MELAVRKNTDYSHGGIDTIAVGGLEGIVNRLVDKVGRLKSLTRPGYEAKVKDESIVDTLQDLANYAEYGILLHRGMWNKDKNTLVSLVSAYVDDEDARKTIYELLQGLN